MHGTVLTKVSCISARTRIQSVTFASRGGFLIIEYIYMELFIEMQRIVHRILEQAQYSKQIYSHLEIIGQNPE